MLHFRLAVVYRPIYALWRILNLVFFFFKYCIFGYRINVVIFWLCFPIIYINHGRIGINTAFWWWLWPDIPSRDSQIITSSLRFSVIISRSLDAISGRNHPQMQYLCLKYMLSKIYTLCQWITIEVYYTTITLLITKDDAIVKNMIWYIEHMYHANDPLVKFW